ncbi:MAG: M48 family metallopeptidase [Pseudomonadota bacterium]
MPNKLEDLQLVGTTYPPGSSHRQRARLVLRPTSQTQDQDGIVDLIDENGNRLGSTPRQELIVDPPLGSAARRMTFPDGRLFETEDHVGVEAIFGRDRWSILHGLEQFHPRLIAITLAAFVGIFVVYRFALGYLVAAAIALTPQPVIEQIDRGTLQTLDVALTDPSTLPDARQEEVRAIFEQMLGALPPDDIDRHGFELHFRASERIGPNAFALPGGTIVFTDQFIEMFPDDDMIATVIGHEIGHVVDEHGLQQFYRALGLYFLITMLAGETGPLMEDVLLEGNALLSLSYSRQHEREADEFGLRLSHAAGFDPSALADLFRQLPDGSRGTPEFLLTHPANDARLEAIERFIAEELN